jgi:hypothetical protein
MAPDGVEATVHLFDQLSTVVPRPSSDRPRAVRRRRLIALTSAVLCSGLFATSVSAAPSTGGDDQHALTALPSGPSSLRHLAAGDGAGDGEVGALAEGQGLTPSEGMANPADKTLLPMEQSMFTKVQYTDGYSNGFRDSQLDWHRMTRQVVNLDDSAATVESYSPDVLDTGRATLERKWPSEPGRLVNGSTESVLDFRRTAAGEDALYTLSSSNAVAEEWVTSPDRTRAPAVGATYAITSSGGQLAVTNPVTGPLGSAATYVDATTGGSHTTSAGQQWAVVDAGEGSVRLVNRADGLCLTGRADLSVVLDACSTDGDRWKLVTVSTDHVRIDNVAHGTLDQAGSGLVQRGSVVSGPAFEFHHVEERGGSVPTWAVPQAKGTSRVHYAAPYDLAVADLDGVHGEDGYYHDEAVVAYTDKDDKWALRVVDYNANTSRLLVTEPTGLPFGKNGTTVDGVWYPGDLVVEAGDFDGDGRNEIATGFQAADGAFTFYFWRYTETPDGGRSLTLVDKNRGAQPFAGAAYPTDHRSPSLLQGYTDSAVGDFDGDGRDDLAVAYGAGTTEHAVDVPLRATLGVWTLNEDLSTRSAEIVQPKMAKGDLPLPELWMPPGSNQYTQPELLPRTTSGVELEAGMFAFDPASGFGRQRSQLAMGWVEYHVARGTDGESPYSRTEFNPTFQIYKTSVADCNAVAHTCTTRTEASGDSEDPRPIFPETPGTSANISWEKWVTPNTRRIVAPPLVFEAGRLGGQAPEDAPVDSIWATYNQTSSPNKYNPPHTYSLVKEIITPWSADDSTTWSMRRFSAEAVGRGEVHRITPYDREGESLELGVPAIVDVEQQVSEDLLAAEPPKHVDWVDEEGEFLNVSGNSEFALETTTSSSQQFRSQTRAENGWKDGWSLESGLSASYTIGVVKLKTAANYKVAQAWSGTDERSSEDETELSVTAESRTNGDDIVSLTTNDYQIYRYPIMGVPGQVSPDDGSACESKCARAYYEVTVPKGSTVLGNGAGKTIDLYDPRWENLNALSYPQSGEGGKVPVPDLGEYTYTDDQGVEQHVHKELYNAPTTVSTNKSTVELDFTKSEGSDRQRTTKRTMDHDVEVKQSGSVKVGIPLIGHTDVEFEATGGWQTGRDTLNASSGSIRSQSGQKLGLEIPAIDPSRSYQIGTAFYYSTTGRPKVTHSVDLTAAANGRSFWRSHYGALPDPALNLPNRMSLAFDRMTGAYEEPYWITDASRQMMRGFHVLHGESTGPVNNAGDPYSGSPVDGDSVVFQAQVSNYSLTPMKTGTTADFYLVPVSDDGLTITGEAQHLGRKTVPALGAQQTGTVESPAWKAAADTSGAEASTQSYRVFVQLDRDGTMEETHPLAGKACPAESLDPNDVPHVEELTDLMSAEERPDPVGCGSNNQGYGTVTVVPGGGLQARAADDAVPNLVLDGAGLVTGDPAHLDLGEDDPVPTVTVGHRHTGLVRLAADAHTAAGALVAVYDGDPAQGKLLALIQVPGTDAVDGGYAQFTWTPDRPGVHELHQVLLGTSDTGADDEQVVRVNVTAAGDTAPDPATPQPPATVPPATEPPTGTDAPRPSAERPDAAPTRPAGDRLATTGADISVLVLAALALLGAGAAAVRHRRARRKV